MKKLALLVSHIVMLGVGFALGVYLLPILIAPPAPAAAEVARLADDAAFKARFSRDLAGSDLLHWGEGDVTVSPEAVTLMGRLAPGPDYKLYLSPRFVEDEASFLAAKAEMVRIGDVNTFENFVVRVPSEVDIERYDTVVVWCEAFGEFITAARYR